MTQRKDEAPEIRDARERLRTFERTDYRVPMRWEPTAEEALTLPHAVLLAASICGIERLSCRIDIGGRLMDASTVQPLNPAAREIFRRLAQWETERGKDAK